MTRTNQEYDLEQQRRGHQRHPFRYRFDKILGIKFAIWKILTESRDVSLPTHQRRLVSQQLKIRKIVRKILRELAKFRDGGSRNPSQPRLKKQVSTRLPLKIPGLK